MYTTYIDKEILNNCTNFMKYEITDRRIDNLKKKPPLILLNCGFSN